MARLLEPGTRVRLELTPANTCEVQVASCTGGSLSLDLLEPAPPGFLGEGSVLVMFSTLSWGVYEWLCVVGSSSETKAGVQLLDGPRFTPRRSDPRTDVDLPADVCLLSGGAKGPPHQAVVTDLSSGGLKLEGDSRLMIDDAIEVSFELPAEGHTSTVLISVLGIVVRVYQDDDDGRPGATKVHVQFIGGQLEAVEALESFRARQLKARR